MESLFVTKRLEVKALRLSTGEWAVIDNTGKTTVYNQTDFHRTFEPLDGHICDMCGDCIDKGKIEFTTGQGTYVCNDCFNSHSRRIKKSKK